MIKIWIERTFYIEIECVGVTYLGLGLNISLISLEICLFFSDWVWMVQFARHMAEETPNWQLRRPTPARSLIPAQGDRWKATKQIDTGVMG